MNENNLIKIALLCIILGLPLLHFLSENTKIELKEIEEINNVIDADTIQTQGKISRILTREKFSIITLQQDHFLDILVFDNISNLNAGDKIKVIGKKETYKGRPEILADKIIKVS